MTQDTGLYRRKDSRFWWMSFHCAWSTLHSRTGTQIESGKKDSAKTLTNDAEGKWFDIDKRQNYL